MFSSIRCVSIVALLGTAMLVSSCTDIAYFDGFETLRIDSSTPETEHPLFAYWVQTEYFLDYAPPVTDADIESLGDPDAEPSARTPWIKADELEMAVHWTLTNDSDESITAWVMLDGGSEFFEWNPVALFGMTGDEDEIAFPSLLGFTPLDIEAGQTLRGEFREDDIREAMFDLDVLTRFCGGPFALLYNRHEVDPVGTEYVPDDATLAGFYKIRLTLGASGPAHLDYGIRVRDRNQVLFDSNATDYTERFEAEPEEYVPTGFAAPMMGVPDPGTMSEYCLEVNPPEEYMP